MVNYDLPESSENYVHRVGRTGRGSHKGQAISFCSTEEKELLAEIETNLGKPIHRMELTKGEYQDTLEVVGENPYDWQKLMTEAEEEETNRKIKKKKKKKK